MVRRVRSLRQMLGLGRTDEAMHLLMYSLCRVTSWLYDQDLVVDLQRRSAQTSLGGGLKDGR